MSIWVSVFDHTAWPLAYYSTTGHDYSTIALVAQDSAKRRISAAASYHLGSGLSGAASAGGMTQHMAAVPAMACAMSVRRQGMGKLAGWSCVKPNVRAKRGPTVGRQARAGENVPRTTSPGLVARRWGSA